MDATRSLISGKLRKGLLSKVDAGVLREKTGLDFGSGPRGYCLDYASLFKKMYATDLRNFSEAYVGTPVEFVESDGERVALPNSSIDVVVSHSVLEHVHDLDVILSDMNRMLRSGGYVYLTISPLYYSPTGLHRKQEIVNWEHLDPNHPSYLSPTPYFERKLPSGEVDMSGSLLNKLTVPEFLSTVGRQPWNIVSFERRLVQQPLPDWIDVSKFGRLNLITKGFSFLGKKVD